MRFSFSSFLCAYDNPWGPGSWPKRVSKINLMFGDKCGSRIQIWIGIKTNADLHYCAAKKNLYFRKNHFFRP